MKTVLAAAALLSLAATSAAADTHFIGHLIFTAKTSNCAADPIGQRHPITFYPGGIGTNRPDSSLAFIDQTGVVNFTLPGGLFDSTLRQVQFTMGYDFIEQGGQVFVKFGSQKPAAITDTTNFVQVTGRIKGIDDVATCIYDFRMIGVRLVN